MNCKNLFKKNIFWYPKCAMEMFLMLASARESLYVDLENNPSWWFNVSIAFFACEKGILVIFAALSDQCRMQLSQIGSDVIK